MSCGFDSSDFRTLPPKRYGVTTVVYCFCHVWFVFPCTFWYYPFYFTSCKIPALKIESELGGRYPFQQNYQRKFGEKNPVKNYMFLFKPSCYRNTSGKQPKAFASDDFSMAELCQVKVKKLADDTSSVAQFRQGVEHIENWKDTKTQMNKTMCIGKTYCSTETL